MSRLLFVVYNVSQIGYCSLENPLVFYWSMNQERLGTVVLDDSCTST